jgi:hypothetical protein
MKLLLKLICILLLSVFVQGIMPAVVNADIATPTPAIAPAPAGQATGAKAAPQSAQYKDMYGALISWGGGWFLANVRDMVTSGALMVKNAMEGLVDKVFAMLCKSLFKLWDLTQATTNGGGANDTGVGDNAIKYLNTGITPVPTALPAGAPVPVPTPPAEKKETIPPMTIIWVLCGALLYLFVVLKLFTGLMTNESPAKMITYTVLVVFLIVTYNLFYSITIQFFSHILTFMASQEVTVTATSLGRNFASTLTNDPETITLIANPGITYDDLDAIYTRKAGTALWIGIIVESLVSCMFIYFILQVLLLKGQQLVQLFLSYFLGVLILPISVLSGFDLYGRWIKSFLATCLYSFVWALLIMLLYTVSIVELGGLASATDSASTALPSILKLMMFFGAFFLMTQVGKIADFFTGGDNFGKIASAGTKEFGNVMRSAGSTVAAPLVAGVAAGAVGGLFMGGAIHGALTKPMAAIAPGAGAGGGSGSGGPGGGSKGGGLQIPGQIGKNINTMMDTGKAIFGAGQATGSGIAGFANAIGREMRNSSQTPNDGKATQMPSLMSDNHIDRMM